MDVPRGDAHLSDRKITRCSHCGTAFRVYSHQLERRGGQVRCGACGEVFDARASLVPDAELPAQADDGLAQPVANVRAEPVTGPAVERSPVDPPITPAIGSLRSSADPDRDSIGVPDAPPGTDAAGSGTSPDDPPADLATTRVSDPDDVTAARQDDDAPVLDEHLDFGPRPPVEERRGLLVGGVVVALVALVIQGTYWFRSELAARAPGLRPLLTAACRPLGCTVSLPRQAELITIESSDLQSDGDYLVLVAILRNRATFTQAFPEIELTLTDPREQPVVRRVLRPPDYLDPSARIDAGAAPGAEVLARVYIDASKVNASGYRVLVFYE
jgi:predicted Zn finger-like uncharacterized protein